MQISKPKFVIMLGIAFVMGGFAIAGISHIGRSSVSIDENKLGEIREHIDRYYLDDYDEEQLVEYAYKGFVAGLDDPYSSYMSKTEYESWKASATGDYDGIGMTFTEDNNGRFVVLEVTADSPAEKAGIKTGDYILTVDGETFTGSDIMAAAIRGEAGTDVTVELLQGDVQVSKKITRGHIVQKSVEYKMLDNNTGYIQISQFIDSTGDDFDKALKKLTENGAASLILDLRDNGGGMVTECVSVADQFLDEGPVCYVEDKNGSTETYDAEDGKTDIPTVVLINENSASASEILAAAMQDNGYILIGRNTFGKGVIQSTMEMDDGSALKLTVMQYLSPKKHVIQKKGIKPDIQIKDKEKTDADEQLEKAKEQFR
ncbi:MAG: S41 family peptidase [Bacillota bacterium]|nr:S41 family peptidase [Bacillota bacterium]